MAKQSIGKALANVAGNGGVANRIHLAARIASTLSDLPPPTVRAIDSQVDFNALSIQINARAAPEVVNLRRAAILVSRTVAALVPAPQGSATSWVDNDLQTYIRQFVMAAPTLPTGVGMYLGSSFWAYSQHDERVQAREAWTEALTLLAAGQSLLNDGNSVAGNNLYRRWFGTASRVTVKRVISEALLGMQTRRTGLSYGGAHAAANTFGLNETGFSGSGGTGSVAQRNEWGATKYRTGVIVLGANFFDPGQTAGMRTQTHSLLLSAGMEVSRGGTMLHEATHLFADTSDVRLSNAVIDHAKTRTHVVAEQQRIEGKRGTGVQGYGPFTCAALAASDPASAANNADSYRLFCEDAYVLESQA